MFTNHLPKLIFFGLSGLVLTTYLAGCAASVSSADESRFDLWCGDHACAWEVEEGEVKQVSTWHKKAFGLGMISDPTVVSQVYTFQSSDSSEYENYDCLMVRLLADFDPQSRLNVALDFCNDGLDEEDVNTEVEDPDWKMVQREAAIPEQCDTVRMTLRKEGKGQVTLAQVEVFFDSGCAANPERTIGTDRDADGGLSN